MHVSEQIRRGAFSAHGSCFSPNVVIDWKRQRLDVNSGLDFIGWCFSPISDGETAFQEFSWHESLQSFSGIKNIGAQLPLFLVESNPNLIARNIKLSAEFSKFSRTLHRSMFADPIWTSVHAPFRVPSYRNAHCPKLRTSACFARHHGLIARMLVSDNISLKEKPR
jgi:hypothetical protein